MQSVIPLQLSPMFSGIGNQTTLMLSRRHFICAPPVSARSAFPRLLMASASSRCIASASPAYNLNPPQWPSDFPLKIAVIADFTLAIPGCRWSGFRPSSSAPTRLARMSSCCWATMSRASPYDALHSGERVGAGAGGLKAPLGVHAILGNHDWWEDKTVQRDRRVTTSRVVRSRGRHPGLRERRSA